MAILYETCGWEEACARLGCSRTHLRKLVRQKKVASFIVAGKQRFPVEGLDNYLNDLIEKSMKEVKP